MEHKIQRTMPTNDNEKDWSEYIEAIRSASRMTWSSGRNPVERLMFGWNGYDGFADGDLAKASVTEEACMGHRQRNTGIHG